MFVRQVFKPVFAFGRFLCQPLHGSTLEPRRRQELAELTSLVFAVCTALFVTKFIVAARDLSTPILNPYVFTSNWIESFGNVWACTAEDFAVGLGCLLVGALVLRLTPSPGIRLALRIVAHAAALLAIAFMIVNAQLFHAMRCFLSAALFEVGGGLKPERSVLAYATPTMKALLALVPLFTLSLHLFAVRAWPRVWQWGAALACRPLLLVAGIAGLGYVTGETQRQLFLPFFRPEFTRNPHLVLACSFFSDFDFGDVGPEPPERDEFLPGRPCQLRPVLPHRPRNVVLIVVECAAAPYTSLYGYPEPTTPRLQQLAEHGVVYDNFYANANITLGSALTLCGGIWNSPRGTATIVDYPGFPVSSPASWLKQQGYSTYFLGGGGLMNWEGYHGIKEAFAVDGWDLARDPSHPFWRDRGGSLPYWHDDYVDDHQFADATRTLRQHDRREPFFMLVWNYDTHEPWNHRTGPDWEERHFPATVRAYAQTTEEFRRYLHSLHHTDELIGQLYDELVRLGLADDTLFIVTGDHGESFGQHGFWKHGNSLYDQEVKVPLLMVNPAFRNLCGPRPTMVASHIDLWPTITDACDVPFNPLWQGRSLLGPDHDRRAFFAHHGVTGVREGDWKYVWDHKARREFLFDMQTDPSESNNLAADHRDLCLRQRRRLRDWTLFQTELTKARLAEARARR
jgi:arylsulfatase A-like enzyme